MFVTWTPIFHHFSLSNFGRSVFGARAQRDFRRRRSQRPNSRWKALDEIYRSQILLATSIFESSQLSFQSKNVPQKHSKASKVDANLRKVAAKAVNNYNAKAPQKSEIFSSGRDGEVIEVGCWINRSVSVPNL